MKEGQFKKGIEELKNIRMTNKEKSIMLSRILSTSIESPYMKRVPVFAFLYSSSYMRVVSVSCFVIVLSFGGAVYASSNTVPGDLFYPVKTRVVEPVLGIVNSSPEKKIVWEKEKIERRIMEAERLADRDELNEKYVQELEDDIEKSSVAFIEAVNATASSSSVSTSSSKEIIENLKQQYQGNKGLGHGDFEEGISTKVEQDNIEDTKNDSNEEKVRKIKNKVIRVLDDYDKSEDEVKKEDEDSDERKNDEEEIKKEDSNDGESSSGENEVEIRLESSDSIKIDTDL